MKVSFLAEDFGFFYADERRNFDFLPLFSFFEKIENAFINEFLQEKSLKGDVVDFPLITGGMGELDLRPAAQNKSLYFYDRSEKGSDSRLEFNSDHFSHTDFDNSVNSFSDMALNSFYNDNAYYLFDYSRFNSEGPQKSNSRNDFKREIYRDKCKTYALNNNKENAPPQIWESHGINLRPFAFGALPSVFFAYGEKAYDMGGKGFFSGGGNCPSDSGNFFENCVNCFADSGKGLFSGGGDYSSDSGNFFENCVNCFTYSGKGLFSGGGNYSSDSGNFFEDCGNCFTDSGNYFAECGVGFDNRLLTDKALERFGAACTDNKISAFNMLVRLFGKGFSDNEDSFLQGKSEIAFNREILFAVSREKESDLKGRNRAFKCRDKVFAEKRKDFAAYEFCQGEKRIAGGYGSALSRGNFYALSIDLLQGEETLSPLSLRQEIVFGGEASHFETAKLLTGKKQAFERRETDFLFAPAAFDGFEAFADLYQASGGSYCLSQEKGRFLGGAVLMRQREDIFEKSLYLCSEESGETHISFDDLKKAIGTGALEYCGKPVKAEVKVDMSGMKNIIYKETSVDRIVADLTAAVSEAVTAAAEGVHIL